MIRKMAISEISFKEMELYADGYKVTDIGKMLGRTFQLEQLHSSFFKITNFGYEGMIPPNVTPKYTPEELCEKVNRRAKFVSRENNLCVCENSKESIGLDSDIRRLDLSIKAFKPLLIWFNNTDQGIGYYYFRETKVPFTIRNLIAMSEQDLLKMRNLGVGGVKEIKEELAKHGFELGQNKPSLNDVIADAAKLATTTGAHGDEPFTNVKERLPEKDDFGR